MESKEADKKSNSKVKPKENLNSDQINEKVNLSLQKIRDSTSILKRFMNDLEPHLSPDFQRALKTINYQYTILSNYDIKLEDLINLRTCIANEFISSGTIDVLAEILPQLFHGLELNGTQKIDEILYCPIKKIMAVFFNYSDASNSFGEEVCKREKLLSLYHRILVSTQEACMQNCLSESFTDILKTTISTLYNTLLYDSEGNLQKIRSFKYLDIIKNYLYCKYERIKINSLLFTAYVADESDSILFRSDQESITYLLKLLSESMKMKSARAKGLSTQELAKGIEKLSKNDENKQLLVDLGVLPILKNLIEKKSMKYKKLALSILWSLAFDERNRKIINETFSSTLDEIKNCLSNPETEINVDKTIKEGDNITSGGLGLGYSNENTCREGFGRVYDNKNRQKERNDDVLLFRGEDTINSNADIERSECTKMLDGLKWTLHGSFETTTENLSNIQNTRCMIPQADTMIIAAPFHDTIVENKINEGHIMISYCWANTDVVMNIYNTLKDLGYKLWIDKYNMAERENLMESMANAVENSLALIVCISSGYKNSQNCRAEAQYAVTKKKPLIPVIVQEKYRPDGWLGFCITGLMYFDFKGKRSIEESMQGLIKQLNKISKQNEYEVDTTDHVTPVVIPEEKKKPGVDSAIVNWTNSQIKEWFVRIGIKKISWKSHYNGQELLFLKTLSNTSLETFFHLSEDKLGLSDLKDLRIFFENIQNI